MIDQFSLGMQNKTTQRTTSQGPATSESNNLPVANGSAIGKNKTPSCSKEIHFAEGSSFVKGNGTRVSATMADLELLAQNRGNAMQRYKEKKKTRRSSVYYQCICKLGLS